MTLTGHDRVGFGCGSGCLCMERGGQMRRRRRRKERGPRNGPKRERPSFVEEEWGEACDSGEKIWRDLGGEFDKASARVGRGLQVREKQKK